MTLKLNVLKERKKEKKKEKKRRKDKNFLFIMELTFQCGLQNTKRPSFL